MFNIRILRRFASMFVAFEVFGQGLGSCWCCLDRLGTSVLGVLAGIRGVCGASLHVFALWANQKLRLYVGLGLQKAESRL